MPRTSSSKSAKSRGQGRRRGSGRREKISPRGDTRFVRRSAEGKFRESDDAGRSLRSDRRKKAKTSTRSGYGDRGDQRGRGTRGQ